MQCQREKNDAESSQVDNCLKGDLNQKDPRGGNWKDPPKINKINLDITSSTDIKICGENVDK